MGTRALVAPFVVVGAVTAIALSGGTADGATRAASTVTIKAEGTDLSGTVSSPNPSACANGRKVIVYKQVGTRGGGDDTKLASDTSEKQGDQYVWSTGNTGVPGHFYAKVKRTPDCKPDTSPTIKATK